MELYQIDYKRLVLLLLPTFLRQPRLFAFLRAMVFSVSEMHGKFLKQRNTNLLRIKRNGQVCYLRGLLNDELDQTDRLITVTDGEADGNWLFAFSEEIASQLLIQKEANSSTETPIVHLLYSEAKIIANTALFIVSVPWPETDKNKTERFISLLNEYKLLSKKYTIKYE